MLVQVRVIPRTTGYMGLDIMGCRPGFVLTERGTENIQKHERVRKVFFLLAIEILSSDFLM